MKNAYTVNATEAMKRLADLSDADFQAAADPVVAFVASLADTDVATSKKVAALAMLGGTELFEQILEALVAHRPLPQLRNGADTKASRPARDTSVDVDAIVRERDKLKADLGRAEKDRDDARRERDEAKRLLTTRTNERDEARRERDDARKPNGDLTRERDTAIRERDAARSQVATLTTERDTARKQAADRTTERDDERKKVTTLTAEKQAAVEDLDAMRRSLGALNDAITILNGISDPGQRAALIREIVAAAKGEMSMRRFAARTAALQDVGEIRQSHGTRTAAFWSKLHNPTRDLIMDIVQGTDSGVGA